MSQDYQHYFIAYKHSEGYGNLEATLPVKIKSLKDIQEVEKYIANGVKKNEGNVIRGVCITNFQLFDK